MVVVGVIGKPRTGKTLFLTMIGSNDYKNGRKIYSNYWLDFPYEKYDIENLLSIASMEMDINPKTVLMQEASKWFDSRRSGRRENVLLTSFTGQSGKREIDIYYDDQFVTRIDRGLRDVTDFTFLSDIVLGQDRKPILFTYTMFGGYFMYQTGRVLKFPAKKVMDFEGMEHYYDKYKTREPTQSLEAQQNL